MKNNKIVLVIAHEGFQHIEYHEPKKILEKAGFVVTTASNKKGFAIAKDGSTTEVNKLVNEIKPADYAGIFFIGGPGALENLDNAESYAILQQANDANYPIGAICVSPRILAKAGVLKGKNATGWNGDNQLEDIYKEYDVLYMKQDVVTDSNAVTATGPHVAKEFGLSIIDLIKHHLRGG